jgi:hypothetical protein
MPCPSSFPTRDAAHQLAATAENRESHARSDGSVYFRNLKNILQLAEVSGMDADPRRDLDLLSDERV